MSILYFDIIPDVETYHNLRASVDWAVFCKEQSELALKNSCFCVVAKDGDSTVAIFESEIYEVKE